MFTDKSNIRAICDDLNLPGCYPGEVGCGYLKKLQVSIPSGGYYLIPQADPLSIKNISSAYGAMQIVIDKNHVYRGSQIISKMEPSTVTYIADGYVTDGKQTGYCESISAKNKNSHPKTFFVLQPVMVLLILMPVTPKPLFS